MRASMSSREKPSAVCVRSLVPNEKKSACGGDVAGAKHARGSSIIVPTRKPSPCAQPSSARRRASTSSRAARSSRLVGDERDHDLERRRAAGARVHRARRRGRSRAPASRRSRDARARAGTPRVPSIGLPSSSARMRSSSCSSSAQLRRRPSGAPRSTRSTSSTRSGRNSCSGGSSSRIVTGSPAIASNRPSKSACWSGSSSSSAARRPASSVGHDHRAHLRLAVGGHEHVLGPAQADALGAELARAARVGGRVGVGAHAERAQLVAPAEHGLEALVDARARRAGRRRA